MNERIGKLVAPAIGDIRAMGEGDTIWLTHNADEREDWPRYWDAIGVAITRGADVRWVR